MDILSAYGTFVSMQTGNVIGLDSKALSRDSVLNYIKVTPYSSAWAAPLVTILTNLTDGQNPSPPSAASSLVLSSSLVSAAI